MTKTYFLYDYLATSDISQILSILKNVNVYLKKTRYPQVRQERHRYKWSITLSQLDKAISKLDYVIDVTNNNLKRVAARKRLKRLRSLIVEDKKLDRQLVVRCKIV